MCKRMSNNTLQDLKADQFDLVVMDPPTFSNSKRMKDDFLDIQRDHVELINHALYAMKPGGILYFSTNYSKFVLDQELIETKIYSGHQQGFHSFRFSREN